MVTHIVSDLWFLQWYAKQFPEDNIEIMSKVIKLLKRETTNGTLLKMQRKINKSLTYQSIIKQSTHFFLENEGDSIQYLDFTPA